jgi:polysaccharide export outer membrane protein
MTRRIPPEDPKLHVKKPSASWCGMAAFVMSTAALSACGVQSPLPTGSQAYALIPSTDTMEQQSQYVLNADDTISLRVFQEPELSLEQLQIDPAGNIDVPLLGMVRAQGYSPSQLARNLEQSFTRYLRNPEVSVALIESGQSIVVEGAVNQPGVFPVRGRSSLVAALAMAQSPTHVAANDQIFVFRTINGRRAGARFDIRRIRAGIDPNPILLPGDEVVVGFSAIKEAWREYLGAPIFNLFRVLRLP